ncbi:translation elongation factor Ts [Loigolactobacillus rennini]|uniref:Elongation factor Ts n=1 Tax=Loigolactobacillus rennini DSM 20253 TaxID=1423796 RepID=A0A0R2D899_9LACO|nr:translation elongation factor Ts [Loigolactobacillus rennini]KRN00126.1 elongation factor Ts [Loigolactobacillus rennini DSM 20253]
MATKITAAQVKALRDKSGAGMMAAKKALVAADGDVDKAMKSLREKGVKTAAKKSGRVAAEGLADIAIKGNTAAIVEVNAETDFVAGNKDFRALVQEIADAIAANQPADMDAANATKMADGQTIADAIINATATIGEKISFRRFAVLTKSDNDNFGSYQHMGGKIAALTVLAGGNEEVARNIAMHVAAINPRYTASEDVPADVMSAEKAKLVEEAKKEGKPEKIVEKIVTGRLNKFLAEICLNDQEYVKDSDQTVGQYAKTNGGKVTKFVRYEVGQGIEKANKDFAAEIQAELNK